MNKVKPALPLRDDTFLGVCEGIGEDFGISGNWLRLAFAGLLFWNPLAALGGYAAAGALVLFSRLVFPKPQIASVAEPVQVEQPAEEEAQAEPVALAA